MEQCKRTYNFCKDDLVTAVFHTSNIKNKKFETLQKSERFPEITPEAKNVFKYTE